MIRTTKLALAAVVLFGTAATSSADTGFKADFVYSADASVEKSYASIAKTAKVACRKEADKFGRLTAVRYKFVRDCQEELIAKAVAKIAAPALLAYHENMTSPQSGLLAQSNDSKG